MNQNDLRAALARREFIASAELVLGRDHTAQDAERFVEDAARGGGGGLRILSVTDLPGGHPALPPEAFAAEILRRGLTPLAHLTGKDGNRALLEGRLHALARLGVENVLALTGDAQKDAFAGRGKPVHDLDSVLILRLIEALRAGLPYRVGVHDRRTTPFDFFPGAVVNPYKVGEPEQMMQLYKLELKLAAGARYIITQLGFDLRKLYEVRQYLVREGLGHVPVLANVYVPSARIARRMQAGEVAGCVVPEALVRRLEGETKSQRLERAALLVAAVRDLGFAGAHIGGFGLTCADVAWVLERSGAIGSGWRGRVDELLFPYPGTFHLLPPGTDGLSDGAGAYRVAAERPRPPLRQRFSMFAHRHFIAGDAAVARFFAGRLQPAASGSAANAGGGGGDVAPPATPRNPWRWSFWSRLLSGSSTYRRVALGCRDCGDCIQDHLYYAGCSMGGCAKELRNGPCGGSRPDGSCEARPDRPCVWNGVYRAARAAGDDPRRFARVLIPPRDWTLDRTNALANRFAGLDNLPRREVLSPPAASTEP